MSYPPPVSPGPSYQFADLMPQPPKRRRRWPLIAVAVAVVLVAFGALLVLRGANVVPAGVPIAGKDTGVAACEAIASDNKLSGNNPDEKMTTDEYQRVRSLFADSRYAPIRDNGTKIIDIVWQMQGMKDGEELAALPLVGTLMEAYAGLTGGCAEHGVTIPPITSGS